MKRPVVMLALGSLFVALAVAAAWVGQGMRELPAYAARRDVAWVGAARLDPEPRNAAMRVAAVLVQRTPSSRFRIALNLYRAATITPRDAQRPDIDPADGEALIAKILPRLSSRDERAQTEVMLGILLAAAAGNGNGTLGNGQGTGGNLLLDQSAHHFSQAIRTDPANEEAKVDLELLLQNIARTKKPNDDTDKGKKNKKKSRFSQPKIRNQKRANVPRASLAHPGSGY